MFWFVSYHSGLTLSTLQWFNADQLFSCYCIADSDLKADQSRHGQCACTLAKTKSLGSKVLPIACCGCGGVGVGGVWVWCGCGWVWCGCGWVWVGVRVGIGVGVGVYVCVCARVRECVCACVSEREESYVLLLCQSGVSIMQSFRCTCHKGHSSVKQREFPKILLLPP